MIICIYANFLYWLVYKMIEEVNKLYIKMSNTEIYSIIKKSEFKNISGDMIAQLNINRIFIFTIVINLT